MMELIIVSLITQLIQCKESSNSEITSTRKISILLNDWNVWKCILVYLGKEVTKITLTVTYGNFWVLEAEIYFRTFCYAFGHTWLKI